MSRFGLLDDEEVSGGAAATSTSDSFSSTTKREIMNDEDVDRVVNWLAHASSSASLTPDTARSELRSALLAAPFDFLSGHLHQLPPTLLALIPLSPAERGANRTITSRRRVYARRSAPEELTGSGSKVRLAGLWARYSEGKSSVRQVEEERERRLRRRQRDEARRHAADQSERSSLPSGGRGSSSLAVTFEGEGDPTDLVGLAEARHPSLGDYLEGADDPRAAAAESAVSHLDDVHAEDIAQRDEEEEEEDEDEDEDAESDASPTDAENARAPPSSTGNIAISAFERHALSLFVAGTDETLPRAFYDTVDFDEQWDAVDDDDGGNEGAFGQTTNAPTGRQARAGTMRAITSEDAYFLEDDEGEE
ncbi:hypothetical protein CF328_g3726 [Tilletia controversa]|nr:hypothetical protein CF328_g3726 [Tilletia controversa]